MFFWIFQGNNHFVDVSAGERCGLFLRQKANMPTPSFCQVERRLRMVWFGYTKHVSSPKLPKSLACPPGVCCWWLRAPNRSGAWILTHVPVSDCVLYFSISWWWNSTLNDICRHSIYSHHGNNNSSHAPHSFVTLLFPFFLINTRRISFSLYRSSPFVRVIILWGKTPPYINIKSHKYFVASSHPFLSFFLSGVTPRYSSSSDSLK